MFFTLYRVLCPTAHSAFPQVLKSLHLTAHPHFYKEWKSEQNTIFEHFFKTIYREAMKPKKVSPPGSYQLANASKTMPPSKKMKKGRPASKEEEGEGQPQASGSVHRGGHNWGNPVGQRGVWVAECGGGINNTTEQKGGQ